MFIVYRTATSEEIPVDVEVDSLVRYCFALAVAYDYIQIFLGVLCATVNLLTLGIVNRPLLTMM